MRIGILAALPGELKPLVKGWERIPARGNTKKWMHRRGGDTWIAVCCGMGAEAARRAFVEAEVDGSLEMVLSVGWAGALDAGCKPGEARAISVIMDAQTGEEFRLTEGKRKLTVVTTVRVADATEKLRLKATYPGAVMVDMEAATVARMAQMRGISVACIKGVSDGVGAKLPDLNPFIGRMGQLRLVPFLGYLALHPKYWLAVAELGRCSEKAAQAICDIVLEFMKERDVERLNRTGSP